MYISNYIILEEDTDLRRLRAGDGTHKFTMDGQVLMTPGAVIPVIRPGVDCIGLAKVEVVTIREDNTTIFFRMLNNGNMNFKAIYEAYATSEYNGGQRSGNSRGGSFGIPRANAPKFNPKTDYIGNDDEDDDSSSGLSRADIDKIFR